MRRLMAGIFGVSALAYGWIAFRRDQGWHDVWLLLVGLLVYGALCGLGAWVWRGKAGHIKLPGALAAALRPLRTLVAFGGTGALVFAPMALPLMAGTLVGEVAGRLLRGVWPAA